jgi:hypothetical protein
MATDTPEVNPPDAGSMQSDSGSTAPEVFSSTSAESRTSDRRVERAPGSVGTLYRLVFYSAYDLKARRCHGVRNRGAIWYPDRAAALAAARRLMHLGEQLLLQPMGGEPEPIAA